MREARCYRRAAVIHAFAQLECSIEMVAAAREAPAPPGARPVALEHLIDFQDALTGEALGAADVATLAPVALTGSSPLAAQAAEASPDGAALRRVWVVAPGSATYTLRVEGAESRRYFGCERAFPVEGAASRRVRVSLVPRMRDVSVAVEVLRGASVRALPDEGLRAVEVRAAAAFEREVEVHAGRCSGERPDGGSHWCVRSLAADARPIALAASVPGYGLASLSLDPRATERTVALAARFQGHFMPTTTVRVAAAYAALNGNGAGAIASIDVAPSSALHGRTCPLDEACVRPVLHGAFGSLGYSRDTLLVGPGEATASDGQVASSLWLFEVGGGVTVVPPGTGDSLRATATASALLGVRDDERTTNRRAVVLSPATTRLGLSAELSLAWRIVGPLQVFAGARLHWFPDFGNRGRDFTFFGDASASNDAASLVQMVLLAGVGIEP